MAMTTHVEKCKGCYFCLTVCPQEAITLAGKLNKQGYEYVQVDEDLCISCGMCYTICPDSVFEIDN